MSRAAVALLAAAAVLAAAAPVRAGTPLPTTREDFRLPGTQPLSVRAPIATPDACTRCHAGYGQPDVEPFQNWKGSMMAQAGRDPLWHAALAVANQDAPHAGETCLRCHLPKGWLEGRSAPEDGSAMTADDRQGVQCSVCHRLVDPVADAANPPEDAAILAALTAPVPGFGGAMMVVDPEDRLRGPFGVVAEAGSDAHIPDRSTLLSPFHRSADLCGTCHNLRNPAFTKNPATGQWELNAVDAPTTDPAAGFPEQSTFDEWKASTYASTGVRAPQFGGEDGMVSTCQDCHMPRVTGKAAKLAPTRTNVPLHGFAGANTFIPAVLPHHPSFGPEVDPLALNAGRERAIAMLRKAATVSASIARGALTVRVANETGHKLPTGYPEGRRMWLHVRAFDAKRHVVFESGRYTFATASLVRDDPHLRVWESEMGISPEVAALAGVPAGRSFHLVLNNLRLKDNRIPPRGFTNAAFAAFDGEPVGAIFADGQYWDEVAYPVGAGAVRAEVTLSYQTASREYVEFLRDENTTTSAGGILYDLWEQVDRSTPVEMAKVFVETDARVVRKCRRTVVRAQARYRDQHAREWARCFAREVGGSVCDAKARDTRLAAESSALRDRLGGALDQRCAGASLTPAGLGYGPVCPAPCAHVSLFDMPGLATCTMCLADALNGETLEAAYGVAPPMLPRNVPSAAMACQKRLERAATALAGAWTDALAACERDNAARKGGPARACADDPGGKITRARARATTTIRRCGSFAGLAGCARAGAADAVSDCVATAIGAVAAPYVEVAYP